jgi:hypothetical protein
LRRREHIATAAYYNAARRGFAPGGELDDWLHAERSLDGDPQPTIEASGGPVGTGSGDSSLDSAEQILPALQGGPSPEDVILPQELHAWADRLSVDAQTLRAAINKVGPKVSDVKFALAADADKGKAVRNTPTAKKKR